MILERLKAATERRHASLEKRVRIARPRPTLNDYRAYLAAMHGFTAPLEACLDALPGELTSELELDKRRKVGLLERDLAELERQLGARALTRCVALPPCDSAARVLGVLYVLEGSTLGARHLLRHLRTLGIEDSNAYLRSYGDHIGAMWQKLRAQLTSHDARDPSSAAELLTSARTTFELLDEWLVAQGAADALEVA